MTAKRINSAKFCMVSGVVMKRWCLFGGVKMWFLLSLSGCLSTIAIEPVRAEIKSTLEKQEVESQENLRPLLTRKIRQLSEVERPSTSARLLVQSPTPSNPPAVQGNIVLITGVQAKPTDKGVEVILETTQGDKLQITNRSAENNFIADIPNAQLRLPNGDSFTFRSQKPVTGIAEITVTNLDANTIRVTVAGEVGLPVVELFDGDEGLIIGLTAATTAMQPPQQPEPEKPVSETPQKQPSAQTDEPIELVVTGEQNDGYRAPDATTGTRLDIPLLETPASIGVITRDLIEDIAPKRGEDLIPFVPGVTRGTGGGDAQGGNIPEFTIRGFNVARQTYINGLRDNQRFLVRDLANIDRIEILKGLSSLLYGTGTPGGLVNYVTKKPQAIPSNAITFQAGSFNSYRGEVDFTGPLNTDKTLLYRLVAAVQDADSFYANVEDNRILVAPSITWLPANGSSLTVETEYYQQRQNFNSGIKFFNNEFLYDRSYVDPRDRGQRDNYRVSAYFDQPLGKNWSLSLNGQYLDTYRDLFILSAFRFNGDTLQYLYRNPLTESYTQLNLRSEVRGNFKIGASDHKLLAGVEYSRFHADLTGNTRNIFFGSIDVFNPTFGEPLPTDLAPGKQLSSNIDYGVYVQDFITLGRFRILAGLRYGWFDAEFNNLNTQNATFLSPTLGLVYKLTDSASVYASFSQSTEPQSGRLAGGGLIDPKSATQYEVGAKANFFNDRLSVTAALFDLTQTNIAETDFNNPDFSILVGEVRSRGLELQVGGKMTDNLSLIAAYTLLDAQITKNTTGQEGNTLVNSPSNSFGLYAKYDFTKGGLRGLSLNSGLVYVGERQGDNANSFDVPSYVRVDLAASYKLENLTFRLGVENLFDTRYVASTVNTANVFQGSPLAITGSISYQF
ncbi:MAG: TonB-dependent siderophore receptor [Nostoc sp. DedSLP03]|uniref:TonB-dependent siderophore receptor n=1 Tax=Nostoc sp. DedSLP03 TaxID=3075400 RepID=UPI002AD3A080|nr:TonB-dependent siderophore receptor [Nostoc sp. DedSLP03]MDZ7970652.1 TonB-dependent siderophore receptor [Nostoc sp. DedSLP03]